MTQHLLGFDWICVFLVAMYCVQWFHSSDVKR